MKRFAVLAGILIGLFFVAPAMAQSGNNELHFVSDIQVVSDTFTPNDETVTLTVECPSGYTAIAGGWHILNVEEGWSLGENGGSPTSTGTGWEYVLNVPDWPNFQREIEVLATCIKAVSLTD